MLPAPATPRLIVFITPVFFVAAGAVFLSAALDVPFLATVDVLLSLDSLMALNLRAFVVAAALALPLADVVLVFPLFDPVAELAVVDLLALPRLPAASFLVDRAFSAQLLKRFDALLCLTGDFGGPTAFSDVGATRVMVGFPAGVGRGRDRTLVEAGESTLVVLEASVPAIVSPRALFLAPSAPSAVPPCSLLLLEVSSLDILVRVRIIQTRIELIPRPLPRSAWAWA